ncbi:MAG TPA: ferrous iron transporter B [Candidatus Ozemobacteraceae bacterium]|nr:ferrous iron transporter B [Candidatus Ozemobacteraceae bacterium]
MLFSATYALGEVPGEIIHYTISAIRLFLIRLFPDNLLIDLLANGLISGIGGVLMFLPNIFFLFCGIAILEESGFFLRSTVLFENFMKWLQLDARALVPLIIGLGCNAPAVMASRLIRNRWQRLRVLFLLPFISCSARLPIAVLLIGTFFPNHPGLWLSGMYACNFLLILALARLTGLYSQETERLPSLGASDLPPYRIPRWKQIWQPVRHHCLHFVEKAGTILLIGTALIWLLQTFPRSSFPQFQEAQLFRNSQERRIDFEESLFISYAGSRNVETSYLGQLGRIIQPLFSPLGFGWRETVALISGVLAKEGIVSTLSVLYGPSNQAISQGMRHNGITPLSALSLLIFSMLYMPCLPTLTLILRESDSTLFTVGMVLFAPTFAYTLAWLIPHALVMAGLA